MPPGTVPDSINVIILVRLTLTSKDGLVIGSLQVKNTPGAALPNTGGPGTDLTYLLGIMLTGLAGTGLVIRRRRKQSVGTIPTVFFGYFLSHWELL